MSSALLVTVLLAAVVAKPPPALFEDNSISGRNRYDRCIETLRRSPEQALEMALSWEAAGGSAGASHCAALSLVSLRRYPEAARRLDDLGHENVGSISQRANLFDQAGNAWLLAGQGRQATQSFASALALSPNDPDILADQARAAAMLGDWKAADISLSAALARDHYRADFLVLRSSARNALGMRAEARNDLEQALKIVPNYPDALVERGALKLESGDVNGARADWQATVAKAPNSAAAAEAQQRLRSLASPKGK